MTLPKWLASVLGGLAAALGVLYASTGTGTPTWRDAIAALIAFIGAIGVPAAHNAGVTPNLTTHQSPIPISDAAAAGVDGEIPAGTDLTLPTNLSP